MVIVLLVVTTITFFVSRLLPGDPTSLWVGDHPTKEQLKTAKKDLGFDTGVHKKIMFNNDEISSNLDNMISELENL